jgi:nitroimidazol reductase NimA-like FMN-containing flavoprotein (pyridoxamine 5'-phosphate oxidase superfamily)
MPDNHDMLGELEPGQIERVLASGVIGRIGCEADGLVYVVPMTYAYVDGAVICHTSEGQKLRMMRKNPNVCFQVDQVEDFGNWRSVIAQGVFKELQGEEAAVAFGHLVARLGPFFQGQTLTPGHERSTLIGKAAHGPTAVVFTIELREKSGRFERRVRTKRSIRR